MGNRQCEQCKQIKNQNAAYGQYEICHLQGKQVALVQKKIENERGLATKIEKELQKRMKIISKHIVHLINYQINHMEYQICINLYYEYMPKTLRQIIDQMNFKGQTFTEKQLFNIIYGVQIALQTLQKFDIQHGCINLDTILLKNNVFKLTDISSTTYLTSYDLVLQGNRQQFLSQKLLNNLNYKVLKPSDTSIHDDLFSLGLITLLLIAKAKPDNFYIWRKSQKILTANFNSKYIEHCIRIMNRNYSSKLTNKVKSLLFHSQKQKNSHDASQNPSTLIVQLKDLEDDLNRVMHKINMKKTQPRTSKQTSLQNSSHEASFY